MQLSPDAFRSFEDSKLLCYLPNCILEGRLPGWIVQLDLRRVQLPSLPDSCIDESLGTFAKWKFMAYPTDL